MTAAVELLWPLEQASGALTALAWRSGLVRTPSGLGDLGEPGGEQRVEARLEGAAARLGLETEPVDAAYTDLPRLVRCCGPALLRVSAAGGSGLLAVVGRGRGRVRVVGPDLVLHRLAPSEVVGLVGRRAAAPAVRPVERLLGRLRIPVRRRERVRAALLHERLRYLPVSGCWLLRLPPSADAAAQARRAGLAGELVRYLALYVLSYALLLTSWWILGRGALGGRLGPAWLTAWTLALVSLVPFRVLILWSQARLAVGAGALLKRRLLEGTFRLESDELRHQGAGQLLGRVLESDLLESNALHGGFLAAVGMIELAFSVLVVSWGAGGWPHAATLVAWWLGVLLLGRHYLRCRRAWTERRLDLTHELVENLSGHRTRLVQQRSERRHRREDALLDGYLAASRRLDRNQALLLAFAPRGWLLVGFCALAPAWISGTASPASLALALGGMLAAFRGFGKLSEGFAHLSGAWIGWEQVSELFRAASRSRGRGGSVSPARDSGGGRGPRAPIVQARRLVYRHRQRPRPALADCSLEIRPGDRLLLDGPSGGGKSTLAAVLSAVRRPDSGLLLLHGLDLHTLGPDAWRRRIACAPQFHENHVLTGSLAFNLLLGRDWPPSPQDLAEAETICRELGLGGLLTRMPGGLQQLVGETGWQLSHGERSRLYIARALLQRPDLVVLDESFAAVDPQNLRSALSCVLRRAPSLLVIEHR